jgi:hypothetical protein
MGLKGMFGRGIGRGNYQGSASGVLDPSATSGWSNKLGLIGDVLTGNPVTQNRLAQQTLDALKAQQAAAGPAEPDVIRELRLSGIDPQSAQGQQAILGHLRPPQYMTLGNAETGQQVIQVGGAGGVAPAQQPAAPQVGAVMQGYRYNGGDPASQTSWTKVQ